MGWSDGAPGRRLRMDQGAHGTDPPIHESPDPRPGGGRRILIVAGEASGDLHGARLAEALWRLDGRLVLEGMGGRQMEQAGVCLLADASQTAVVGGTELWEKRRVLSAALGRLRRQLRAARPDLLICIDFPDFNLLLARSAHRAGIPVCYFISPQIWAWRRWRIRTIRRLVRKMLVLFPFEETLYRQAGVDVTFVGHPLLDTLAAVPPREACRAAVGLPQDAQVVGLLPGSRTAELRRHLPLLLAAGATLRQTRPGLRLLLGLAPTLPVAEVEQAIRTAGVPVEIAPGRTAEVMRAADLLLAVSGTVTLEAAILGTPMVITYRLGWLSALLAWPLVRVPFIGLPNIVAERKIVPELIQLVATPQRLAAAAAEILDFPERQATVRAALAEVRQRLGTPGASMRAAREVLALLPAA
jgi:lipid-A-disaccharide synthase